MARHKKIIAAATLIGLLSATTAATGHAIWFAQRATQLALIYGNGSDDLDMVKKVAQIRSIVGYDAQWKPVPTKIRIAGPLPFVESEGETVAIAAVLDNGMWSHTPEGDEVKGGRDTVPNATNSSRTMKYAVYLSSLTAEVPPLPGQVLQIVPVGPIPELLGKPMKLRVLYNGKPAAGAQVLADYVNDPDSTPIKTAVDGTATINVRNQGHNVLVAWMDGPPDDPKKVDKTGYRATLSFVLPHKPE